MRMININWSIHLKSMSNEFFLNAINGNTTTTTVSRVRNIKKPVKPAIYEVRTIAYNIE